MSQVPSSRRSVLNSCQWHLVGRAPCMMSLNGLVRNRVYPSIMCSRCWIIRAKLAYLITATVLYCNSIEQNIFQYKKYLLYCTRVMDLNK